MTSTPALLSGILLELYPLALSCPIGEFEPRLFSLLARAIRFDCAWAGRIALTQAGPVRHNSVLHGLPAEFVAAWERAKQDDPVAARVAGKASIVNADSVNGATLPPSLLAIGRRFGLAQALNCVRDDQALGLHTFLSLYRRAPGPAFSAAEQRLMALLMPHISSATDMNRLRQIDRVKALGVAASVAVAVCDRLGVLQYADEGFVGQMRREWPDWTGPSLPASLLQGGLGDGASRHAGRELFFDTSAEGELLVVRVWPRTAVDALSPRELTVARMFSGGLSHKEVAQQLGLAPATVRHQLREAYRKLGVQDKGQIASLLSRHAQP